MSNSRFATAAETYQYQTLHDVFEQQSSAQFFSYAVLPGSIDV